jgi:uncharacterized protein (TIGR00251 family)
MAATVERLMVPVRAKPGARAPRVGGSWGDPPRLVVAVAEPAADGAANRAVVAALAAAFGVRRGEVELVHGASGRSKLVAIEGDVAALRARLAQLLAG